MRLFPVRTGVSAGELRREGVVCVVPHLESVYNEDALSEEGWLDHGLVLLERCDAVLVLDRWEESKGTLTEVEFAERRGLPVFKLPAAVLAWRDLGYDIGRPCRDEVGGELDMEDAARQLKEGGFDGLFSDVRSCSCPWTIWRPAGTAPSRRADAVRGKGG